MNYQDVLAAVGAGSAHPGGVASTRMWIKLVEWRPSMRVLDVGCGTGRTLLDIQQQFGCEVTGVDVRPHMIKKARKRAAKMGLSASWKVGSAEHLPFRDESFDVVLTESVNVFVNAGRALREYFRVLKRPGTFVDVEMMVLGPVTAAWHESVKRIYGALDVPDLVGWKEMYREAGFDTVRVLTSSSVRPEDSLMSDQLYPDPVDVSSPGVFNNPFVIEVLKANASWLEENHRSLGYGVFLCRKSGPSA